MRPIHLAALAALAWSGTAGAQELGSLTNERVELEAGFSVLRASYHREVSRRLTIGGAVGFDYAYFAPDDAFGAAVLVAAPLRYLLVEDFRWEARLRFEPGLYFGIDQPKFSQFIAGVLLGAGASAGYWVDRALFVGGGLDLPLVLGAPTGGRDLFVAAPVLIGPIAEWRASDRFTLSADLKVGPHFMSDDYFGTRLGFRLLLGASYRL